MNVYIMWRVFHTSNFLMAQTHNINFEIVFNGLGEFAGFREPFGPEELVGFREPFGPGEPSVIHDAVFFQI